MKLYSPDNVDDLMGKFVNLLNEKYDGKIEEISGCRKWIINSGLDTNNILSDRVLLCGENIHSAYSFSGEGVAPAIKTGIYAAETIIGANGDYSKKGLSYYKKRVEEGIGPTHKIYNIMSSILGTDMGFKIVCWFLRNSKRAKKLVEGVMNEEVPLRKGFLSTIFYSRKL
jgi:flavin-dependent dehydrogenase